ncbi:MAG: helix-turn-helix transcriptional regulator [Magnetococcales bacterium]|nr:helix-turn-helix transcriptional regulator [Magnetococcales bacterium]
MMPIQSFADLFAEAEKRETYWQGRVILEYTTDLYQAMLKKNLSKKQFADLLGVKPPQVSKIFRGEGNFTVESMVRWANALDCQVRVHVGPKGKTIRICDASEHFCSYTPDSSSEWQPIAIPVTAELMAPMTYQPQGSALDDAERVAA